MQPAPSRSDFIRLADQEAGRDGTMRTMIPVGVRLMGDQLTPVLAYRRLVVDDERTDPSFLLESVEGGERIGRYSLIGAHPAIEVVARANELVIRDHRSGREKRQHCDDPLDAIRRISDGIRVAEPPESSRGRLPQVPLGGWFGYAGYDAVRYTEPGKLPFDAAPRDDRALPDISFGFYDELVVFDHVQTLVHIVRLVEVASGENLGDAYDRAQLALEQTARALQEHSKPLASGEFDGPGAPIDWTRLESNITREEHAAMVGKAQEYIRAGDIFQVVIGQRFATRSGADPFDVYRTLRALNPSPYMGYLQGEGCMLVASSPEILCRVERDSEGGSFVVTNRPLAGTRPRGRTPQEDADLERLLLADQKELAEHVMLVDLGRNDVGKVSRPGSVELAKVMEVERYSHVMHISSTVQGLLRPGLDCWDALRAALPVGTVSGAPKIRAMQIIDELEPLRRGPYGGGFGYVGLDGAMDIALALRTIVVPTGARTDSGWTYHLQAAGGIVADSEPEAEFQETVNKASALARAIQVAEQAFCT